MNEVDRLESDLFVDSSDCRLIHMIPAKRCFDDEGGMCIPGVWRNPDGEYLPGYRTDTGTDIVFVSRPTSNPFEAARLAQRFTADMCAQ